MQSNLQEATRDELFLLCTHQATQILNLQNQLAWFKRQYFGAKSERVIPQDPRQSTLFEVPEQPPHEKTTVKQYERASRKNPTSLEQESKSPL